MHCEISNAYYVCICTLSLFYFSFHVYTDISRCVQSLFDLEYAIECAIFMDCVYDYVGLSMQIISTYAQHNQNPVYEMHECIIYSITCMIACDTISKNVFLSD